MQAYENKRISDLLSTIRSILVDRTNDMAKKALKATNLLIASVEKYWEYVDTHQVSHLISEIQRFLGHRHKTENYDNLIINTRWKRNAYEFSRYVTSAGERNFRLAQQ